MSARHLATNPAAHLVRPLLRRSRSLLAMAEAEFSLPVTHVNCREEAATGAALVAKELVT